MKNAKASKLELASPRRRGDSQIICRGQPSPRSSPRSARGRGSASASELEGVVRELQCRKFELEAENAQLRSAGRALALALGRYTELFDFAPLASVAVSLDGTVRELNQAASQRLGVSIEVCGRPFRSLVAEEDRERFDGFLARQRTSRTPLREELWLLCAGQARFAAQLASARLPSPEPSILIAFEDITERRTRDASLVEAQRALREADRRKDEFLALLSHELRNPLTPLANCLFVLSRSEPGSERAHAAHSIMQRQVDLLTRLTEDLLDVTRIARGKMRLSRERVDWGELLEHSVEDHRSSFDASGIRLDSRIQPGAHWVRADPARLTQAMSNLLGNALKFTPRAGRVAVSLARDRARVTLRVSDNGAGIAAEMLPWVFEPFSQAPQTLDRSQGGLGLGLAMVRGLVELHGGAVHASSAGPGLGTELSVWLPRDASGERPAQATPPDREGTASEHHWER